MSLAAMEKFAYSLLDKGLIPDFILRPIIRALCRQRLREIDHGSFEANHAAKMEWIENVKKMDTIAVKTEKANEQHYEVLTSFIMSCLGPYAKYSSCLYPTGRETLEEAEILIMESYCEKAQLKDGQDVLDLGCGWGSLSLYLAEKYPHSRVIGLSNSSTQRQYILSAAEKRSLKNIEIITADVNTFDFEAGKKFDRILSIEMFEHMKNYQALMRKVASWLRPRVSPKLSDTVPTILNNGHANGNGDVISNGTGGHDESLAFIHIFCHRSMPYHFEESDGWMAQMFFSGGTMMSHDLLTYFQSDLTLLNSWYVNGRHYSHTLEDWLKRQDKNAKQGLAELEKDAEMKGMSREEGRKAFSRFRVFYIACSELFALNGGNEWGVGHYLFKLKD